MNAHAALADLILAIHFAFVAFVMAGFVIIWIGHFCRWSFVRNFGFRVTHLLAMGFVAFQSLAGMACPLTTWENALRVRAGASPYQQSFVEHWLGRILFYDLNESAFTAIYLGFLALLVLTFWKGPPRLPKRFSRRKPL